ncbi:hypothetical protein ACJX0J_035353 [Zea mays]
MNFAIAPARKGVETFAFWVSNYYTICLCPSSVTGIAVYLANNLRYPEVAQEMIKASPLIASLFEIYRGEMGTNFHFFNASTITNIPSLPSTHTFWYDVFLFNLLLQIIFCL